MTASLPPQGGPGAVDYYAAFPSPWTYLGHARFRRIAREAGAAVRLMPFDLGKVFPVSGGLPLPQRAPQRQSYRLLELARFSRELGIALNLQPRHFPVAGDAAAKLVIAVDQQDGVDAAMELAGAVLGATWGRELDISAGAVLSQLLQECGLPAQRLADADAPRVAQQYAANTQQAIVAGVFGAPTYVVQGELFWGQDRLDFVQRRLARTAKEQAA